MGREQVKGPGYHHIDGGDYADSGKEGDPYEGD